MVAQTSWWWVVLLIWLLSTAVVCCQFESYPTTDFSEIIISLPIQIGQLLVYWYMGESFQDCSWIQDFEADFP